jgi:hypothetical protein
VEIEVEMAMQNDQLDQLDQLEFEKTLYKYPEYKIYENEISSKPIAKFVSRDYIHGDKFDQYNRLSKRELLWDITRYGEFDMKYIVECLFNTYYMEDQVELNDINENNKKEIVNFAINIKNNLFDKCYANIDNCSYDKRNIDKQIDAYEKNINLSCKEIISSNIENNSRNKNKYVLPGLIRKVILATIIKDNELLQECCDEFHNDYILKIRENKK